MNKIILHFLTISALLVCSVVAQAQLPANCPSTSISGAQKTRSLMMGDSWAQYMYDDGVHNKVFKAYGHGDKKIISETFEISLFSGDPDPQGTYYGVSGSEARQWRNEGTYAYMQNVRNALSANPDITLVVLSIGGNDVLAGRSDCGWYKNMNLDPTLPGRGCGFTNETTFFNKVESDIQYVIDQVLAVRPNIEVLISSYDYPNFNVTTSWLGCLGCNLCNQYACPKREDLSYDVNGNGSIDASELITDAEINQMMVLVEQRRQAIANASPRVHYDNSMGLMHYFYGNTVNGQGTTPYPEGQKNGTYPWAAGGNAAYPSLRDNFRLVDIPLWFDAPADPIHLTAEGYEYKAKNQMDNVIFDHFRGVPTVTVFSDNTRDGYADAIAGTFNTNGIRVGDNGSTWCSWCSPDNDYRGILSFNLALPSNATITGASIYMMKSGEDDNPFKKGDRNPVLDMAPNFFGGSAALEAADATDATGIYTNIGCFHGQADNNYDAIRIDIANSALPNIVKSGTTQFRFKFDKADWSPEYINFYDGGGTGARPGHDITVPTENEVIYKEFLVQKTPQANGSFKEEIIETYEPIERKNGYAYEHQVVSSMVMPDGSILERNMLMPPLAHNGLAKYMGDNYNGGTEKRAPFIDVTYTVPVPVEMLDFKARAVGRSSQLDWATASENNTRGFDVEHSTDGVRWQKIGFVAATGNSSTRRDYQFTHKDPHIGLNYYRLLIIDNDNTTNLSAVKTVAFRNFKTVVEVYPNPFNKNLDLHFNFAKATTVNILLMDVLGRTIHQSQVALGEGLQSHTLENLQDLTKGTYFLQVFTPETMNTVKVVKE